MGLNTEFAGRIALVTGAASGIGRVAALMFAARGAQVACVDIAGDACRDTADLIRSAGGQAHAIEADLATPAGVRDALAAVLAACGRIDHAFNNAGISGGHGDPFDEERFQRTISINLEAVAWCMKHEIAHMTARPGGGTIVNTASIAGLSGAVGAIDYTAAKHAVVGMTGAAALRYGPRGVRINAVCPGIIATPMLGDVEQDPELRRTIFARLSPITGAPGTPDDIAEAVLFLSGDRARFIHGVALPVDGGFSI